MGRGEEKRGGQKSRRDDILVARGKRRRSATPGLNATGITPATVVRQKKMVQLYGRK